jgi:hypothetical protein
MPPAEHVAPLATHIWATQQPPWAQVLLAQQAWPELPQPASGASRATSFAVSGASTAASDTIDPPVPPIPPVPPVEMGPSMAPPVSVGPSLPPTPPVAGVVSLPPVPVSVSSTAASVTMEPPVPPEPPIPPVPPVEMGPSVAAPVSVGPSLPPTPPAAASVSLPSGAAGTSGGTAVSSLRSGAPRSGVTGFWSAPSWEWRSLLGSKEHAAVSAAITQRPARPKRTVEKERAFKTSTSPPR